MPNYTHTPKVSHWLAGYNASTTVTIAANLFVVQDTSKAPVGGAPCVGTPATSATLTDALHLGISPTATPPGRMGNFAGSNGDVVLATASGSISEGDKLQVDSASGKEGRVKTSTADGLATNAQLVAHALEAASDGGLLYIRIQYQHA